MLKTLDGDTFDIGGDLMALLESLTEAALNASEKDKAIVQEKGMGNFVAHLVANNQQTKFTAECLFQAVERQTGVKMALVEYGPIFDNHPESTSVMFENIDQMPPEGSTFFRRHL